MFSPSVVGDASTILSGGTSRLSQKSSDIGNVITAASPVLSRREGEEDEEEDEDEEDSYAESDSLEAFRDHEGSVMLPTHDGLGSFHSSPILGGFHSLEESLRIVAASARGGDESDTYSRIEKWRVEQGQALIEEIQLATRRRRLSIISRQSGETPQDIGLSEEDSASMGGISDGDGTSDTRATSRAHSVKGTPSDESFLKRITRCFIRDIIGLDDNLLEVIFGEALPAEAYVDPSCPVSAKTSTSINTTLSHDALIKKDVEERIFSRIAKELGALVNLYTQYPHSGEGPFSTLRRPIKDDREEEGTRTPQPSQIRKPEQQDFDSTFPQIQFTPTLSAMRHDPEEDSHAALWGIEEEQQEDVHLLREYLEQDLDLRLVFSFLRSRFSGQPTSRLTPVASPTTRTIPLHHNHPLTNRNSCRRRGSSSTISKQLSPTTSPVGCLLPKVGGGSSYCANQERAAANDQRSSKASSRSRGHYWDVATSVGSGQTGSCVGTGVWAAI